LVSGRPVTAAQLANLVGGPGGEVEAQLDELEEAGVFSRDDGGVIYSRRMRRDEEKARKDRANGKAGGNPALKPGVNQGDKAQKPESRLQTLESENSAASASPPRNDGRLTDALWPPRNDGVCGARLDDVEAACRAALGEAAPLDAVIGPMLPVVEKFGAARVSLELASQARRKRRRPIKSWRLWAEIVAETLAEQPRAPPPPAEDMTPLLHGESVPRAALLAAIERWNAGGDWPSSLGGPPHRHGCALPEELLALCVDAT
jgi:hypothetical protein